jgi:hypothetical protein
MRRIYTTFDLLEAHTIVAMLREHAIRAWVFDADFVRQDWFKAIAYGGYRIVVNDESGVDALELLGAYRAGTLALADEHRLQCPNCGEFAGSDDPWPRRSVFLAMITVPWVAFGLLSICRPSPTLVFWLALLQLIPFLVLPGFVIRYVKWRFACSNCQHRWRDQTSSSYRQLSGAVESESDKP